MISREDIVDLVNAARLAGFNKVRPDDLKLIVWEKGDKHKPLKLPKSCGAVYLFKYKAKYLKVGKAGQNSNPRYQHQHYRVSSNISTLAKSIVIDNSNSISKENVKNWIKENTTRYNIIIPCEYDSKFINFVEAFFILKCQPKYEGRL